MRWKNCFGMVLQAKQYSPINLEASMRERQEKRQYQYSRNETGLRDKLYKGV